MSATGSSYSTTMQPYADDPRRMSTTTNMESRSYHRPTRESIINHDDSMTLSPHRIDRTSSLWPLTRIRFDVPPLMVRMDGTTTTVVGQQQQPQPPPPLPNLPFGRNTTIPQSKDSNR
jgi:hypothetical protein